MTPVTTARAALLLAPDDEKFTVDTIELASPQPEEVIVSVKASSLCHSDWNYITNDYGQSYPALLGHEVAGVVTAIGDRVSTVSIGDHVVACSVSSCGECDRCLEGQQAWCQKPESGRTRADGSPRGETSGTAVWQLAGLGGFADHILIDQHQLVAVDKRVPFDRAAVLGCGVVTGAGSVIRAARVQPRETVLVFGAGGVGLSATQAGALVGARKVIVVDVADDKLELSRRFGATHTINATREDPVEAVMRITDNKGVDQAFEMTGLAGPLRQGYDALGVGGTVYIVGMQKPGSEFSVPAADLGRARGIRPVRMGSTNFRVDIPYYAELYLQGRFNLDDLVSTQIPLDDINEGYARLLAGGGAGRTVITFD